jgi:hypothetical protein
MLKILNAGRTSRSGFCDGVSRRNFLQIGGLALGGLALPNLLRAESAAGLRSAGRQHKAVIMIFLPGGPSHQDMFDLKADAPAEVRGEFRPIPTNVPGLQICEHLPKLARLADKYTVIRSMVGAEDRHDAFQCQTGHLVRSQPAGGWPSMGSFLARLQGSANPPWIASPTGAHYWAQWIVFDATLILPVKSADSTLTRNRLLEF